MSIIDCHVHLNKYEITSPRNKENYHYHYRNIPSLSDRLDSLLKSMEKNSINYSLVLSSYRVNEDRPSTSQIIKMVNEKDSYSSDSSYKDSSKNGKIKDKIGSVAGFTIDNHTEEDLKDCRKWLKDGTIKGIKLYCGYEHHYPYDERYQKVYDLCIEFDYPLMIHSGDVFSSTAKIKYAHPLNLDEVAVDNPDLKIVICHIGNPWITDCQEVVYKNKNVYADISGLTVGSFSREGEIHYIDKINEFLRYTESPHKLLFGTDWPIADMDSYIQFAKRLNLDSEDQELLMYRNAKNIFKL
jgi:Tat protein secretion system quality control protein TatD with DNase activity